jgi:hypothetical protein
LHEHRRSSGSIPSAFREQENGQATHIFFSILLDLHRRVYFGEGGLCDFRGALAAVLYDLVDV